MKFGIEIGSQTMHEVIQISKAAEESEFSTVWIADHVPATRWRDPFIAMSAIAQNTEDIRIGCGVFNPYSRQVGILGVAAASLAELYGERFVLGLGAGGTLPLKPLEIEMWDKPVTAIKESIAVLRELFSGNDVDFKGKIVTLRNTKLFGEFSIPICVGTRGQVLSKLAGKYADGIILNPPLSALPVFMEKVREGMKESNNKKLEVIEFLPVGFSELAKYGTVKPTVALLIPTTPKWALEMIDAVEPAEMIAEKLKVDRAKAAELVPEHLMTSFAISGDVRSCIEQIKAIQDDVTELVALSFASAEGTLKMMEIFKKDIIPSF
ncbi:MAG: LLM class flavin-dependent oxidoreductase [Candidatus Thorarchaeota archaeon]